MKKDFKSTYEDCLKVLWARAFEEYNIVIRKERLDSKYENGKFQEMIVAYNGNGDYAGSGKFAYRLMKRGNKPELSKDGTRVCSIGKSIIDNKWYGWSHRAICGFQIGDIVKSGDCCASSGFIEEYEKEHPEECRNLPIGFIAKTEDDCKKMAIAFSDSVS